MPVRSFQLCETGDYRGAAGGRLPFLSHMPSLRSGRERGQRAPRPAPENPTEPVQAGPLMRFRELGVLSPHSSTLSQVLESQELPHSVQPCPWALRPLLWAPVDSMLLLLTCPSPSLTCLPSFPVTYTNSTFHKLTNLWLINNNEWLCSDCQAPFSGNRAAIFNVESVFSPINTAASTPVYWCVIVFVYKNVFTQCSSDHKACDPENGRNHWNLVLPHVFPLCNFTNTRPPTEPQASAARRPADSPSLLPPQNRAILAFTCAPSRYCTSGLAAFYH